MRYEHLPQAIFNVSLGEDIISSALKEVLVYLSLKMPFTDLCLSFLAKVVEKMGSESAQRILDEMDYLYPFQ